MYRSQNPSQAFVLNQSCLFFIQFYQQKSLKTKVEGNKRSIVGLTTEMEEVRKRIRQLLNKRVSAAGPDYDEYKLNQKVSKTIVPVDISTRRTVTSSSRTSSSVGGGSTEETSVVVEESSSSSSVSVTMTTETTSEEGTEE